MKEKGREGQRGGVMERQEEREREGERDGGRRKRGEEREQRTRGYTEE